MRVTLAGASRPAAIIVGQTRPLFQNAIRNLAIDASGGTGHAQGTGTGHGLVFVSGNGLIENVIVQYPDGDAFHYAQDLLMTKLTGGPYTLSGSGQNISLTTNAYLSSSGGTFTVNTATGPINVTYTGLSGGTTATGCTGSGTISSGQSVGYGIYDLTTVNSYAQFMAGSGWKVDWNYASSEWFACRVDGAKTKPASATNVGFLLYGTYLKFSLCHAYLCNTGLQIGDTSVFTAASITVLGGEWETNVTNGVKITNNTGPILISGAQFYGNGLAANPGAGTDIFLGTGSTEVFVSECVFRQGTGGGLTKNIYALLSTWCVIQNCEFDYLFIGQNIFLDGASGAVSHFTVRGNQSLSQASSTSFALLKGQVLECEVLDNTIQGSIVEQVSGITPNYNRIHRNVVVGGWGGSVTTVGQNSEAWENKNTSDVITVASTTATAPAHKLTRASSTSATATLSPPGYNVGGIALAAGSTGVTLPQATVTLASSPVGIFPVSGSILVPLASGYTTVRYTGISGNSFTGCTGGSGTTASGSVYALPAGHLKFQAVATDNTNGVTISCPTGMTINGLSSNLSISGTVNKVWTAMLSGTDWLIY